MPVIFRYAGFRFFFYANEGTPREPIHIHVEQNDCEAKFWIKPVVSVAYNNGYGAHTLHQLRGVVAVNRLLIERAWNDFFGG
jgi:hypothetical protein